MFGLEPVMAMSVYSNFGSSKDETALKLAKQFLIYIDRHPDLL